MSRFRSFRFGPVLSGADSGQPVALPSIAAGCIIQIGMP